MHTFANKGPENTQTTLKLALEKANELQTSLVIATKRHQHRPKCPRTIRSHERNAD